MAARIALLVLIASHVLAVSIATAATEPAPRIIYVSTAGRDNNPGTITAPVATPAKALDLASRGDAIQFRAGRYRINRFVWVGTPNLTISSYPGERAVVFGGTDEHPSNPSSIFIIVADNVVLEDLEIEGGSYYGVKVDVDRTPTTSGVTIRRCYIHHTGRDAIKTFNADNLLIEDCEIGFTGVRADNAEGIDSIGSVGAIIRRNYIHDTRTTGVYLKGGTRDGLIERNRVENAGNSGILLGQDTDPEFMRDGVKFEALDSVVRNNVIVGTRGAGIGTYSGRNVRFENNTVVNVAMQYHAGFYAVMNTRDIPPQKVVFKNNIVVMGGTKRPMAFVIGVTDRLDSDNNIWFRTDGAPLKFSREIWPEPSRYDYWNKLSDWQSNMQADLRSIAADPLLDAGDLYRPLAGSPAIDRGASLSGVVVDFSGVNRPQGSAFDIGAHESTLGARASRPQGFMRLRKSSRKRVVPGIAFHRDADADYRTSSNRKAIPRA